MFIAVTILFRPKKHTLIINDSAVIPNKTLSGHNHYLYSVVESCDGQRKSMELSDMQVKMACGRIYYSRKMNATKLHQLVPRIFGPTKPQTRAFFNSGTFPSRPNAFPSSEHQNHRISPVVGALSSLTYQHIYFLKINF